jgi:anaerobic ribonucleoside-triphosphate reductase activating protein
LFHYNEKEQMFRKEYGGDKGMAVFPDAEWEAAKVVNVAAKVIATRALGPGIRAGLWVQGCALACPGCIAPDWIPIRPAVLAPVDVLAGELLRDARVTGLTISGGEPMLQAAALAQLVRAVRAARDLNIIVFTGFRYEQLHQAPPGPGVADFLAQVDVLIDGPYIQRLNNNLGLRGSANQRILHLTDRLNWFDFEQRPRQAELHFLDGQAMLVGVPPVRLKGAFEQAIAFAESANTAGRIGYERV